MIALDDHWIWDSWYLHDGTQWHCWYLKAPKSIVDPELRHWNVSQGHAVSNDLINWEHRGTALAPSTKPAWDDKTTWTGSTLKGDDGRWHYYYTGTSKAEDANVQRIGHAVGDDLENWERVDGGLCLDIEGPNAHLYETAWEGVWHDRALRDPWVMKDPDGDGWLMYFTARSTGVDEVNDAGCIGLATSDDMYKWTLQPPVFTGGWGQLEVPQVFKQGEHWYCLFCMVEPHQAAWNLKQNGPSGTGNHYLIAENPRGPWRLPEGAALDTQVQRYAARIVDDNGMQILGFKNWEGDTFGGYIMDPAPVYQHADGSLSLEP